MSPTRETWPLTAVPSAPSSWPVTRTPFRSIRGSRPSGHNRPTFPPSARQVIHNRSTGAPSTSKAPSGPTAPPTARAGMPRTRCCRDPPGRCETIWSFPELLDGSNTLLKETWPPGHRAAVHDEDAPDDPSRDRHVDRLHLGRALLDGNLLRNAKPARSVHHFQSIDGGCRLELRLDSRVVTSAPASPPLPAAPATSSGRSAPQLP